MAALSPWPIQTTATRALAAVAQEKEGNLLRNQVSEDYQKEYIKKMSQTEMIVLRLLGLQRNLPPDEGRRMGETTRL